MSEYDFNEINRRARANQLKKSVAANTSLIYGDTTKPAPGSNLAQNQINATNQFFSPLTSFKNAEPYLPLLRKYWKEEDIPKAIWTAHWESGFRSERADAPGSDGATGIFRVQNLAGRPSIDQLMDPEFNIKYAAELAYGPLGKNAPNRADFTPWGDNGATYNGKPYGALSVRPFPGDENVVLPSSPLPPAYDQIIRQQEEIITGYEVTRKNKEAEIESFITEQRRIAPTLKLGGGISSLLGLRDKSKDTQIEDALKKTQEFNLQIDQKKRELADIVTNEQREQGYLFLLSQVQFAVFDADTNIRSVDDLLKTAGPLFKAQTGRDLPEFNDYQKEYLNKAVQHIAPFANRSDPAHPVTEKQVLDFLTVARSANVPSKRVSIAGLSNSAIRSALTTLPGGKNQLPAGLTEEKLRAYFASQNLLSPEQQAEVNKLKGTFAEQVKKWAELDNRYQAYKLGLNSPSNLDLMKGRNQSILAWPLERLEEWQKHVVRPAAAWGISGLANINDILGGVPYSISPYGATRNALNSLGLDKDLKVPFVGNLNPFSVDVDTDELRAQIRNNRLEGQSWWTAGGNAWKEWDANGLVKFMSENIADPMTYLGFGVYPKVFSKVPILGRAVEAVESGWKTVFDNPLVAQATLTGVAGGLTYQATGDFKASLATAGLISGVPVLRGVNLYTPRNLTIKNLRNTESYLREAVLGITGRNTLDGLTTEQFTGSLQKFMDDYAVNPTLAHQNPNARAAKALIQANAEWIDNTTISTMLTRLGAGDDILDSSGRVIGRKAAANLSDSELLSVNNWFNKMLNSPDRGIFHVDQVADEVLKIISPSSGYYKRYHDEMKDILVERMQNDMDRIISEASKFPDGGDSYIAVMEMSRKALEASYSHRLWRYGEFQGTINGLMKNVSAVERSRALKTMGDIQNFYAQTQLVFGSFKPWNFFETWFRVAGSGVSHKVPAHGDMVSAANFHLGWNRNTPNEIVTGEVKRLDSALVDKTGGTVIPRALRGKEKEKVIRMKDWNPFGKAWANAERNLKGKFTLQAVADEFAKADPAGYKFLQELQEEVSYKLSQSSMSREQVASITNDMWFASLRPNGPEVIRNMMTDLPSYEREVFIRSAAEKMSSYQWIDEPTQHYMLRELERGNWDNISTIISDAQGSMLDHFIVRGEINEQAMKDYTQQVLLSIDELTNPEDLAGILSHINAASDVAAAAAGDIKGAASIRAGSIRTEQGKNDLWENANRILSQYMETSDTSINQMVEALRTKIASSFPENQARILNRAIDTISEKTVLMRDTRTRLDKVISDYEATNGHRPHGEQWDNLIEQRSKIWDEYFEKETELVRRYQSIARDFSAPTGELLDASGGLTVAHVAKLMSASGDGLANGLVQMDATMPRGKFIGLILGEADAQATKLGTTPESLGWTRESVGQIYDNLRIRAGTNPADDTALLQARLELDQLGKDLHALRLTSSKKPEEVDILNDAYSTWANRVENQFHDIVRVSDLTPNYIQPRDTGIGLKSRYEATNINRARVRVFQANDTQLEVFRHIEGVDTYEVSVNRASARGSKTREQSYATKGEGSDLEALVEVGQIIDDLQRNNPQATFIAHPTDERRRRIYVKAGFKPRDQITGQARTSIDPTTGRTRLNLSRAQGFSDENELILDRLKLPRPAPVATPGTGTTIKSAPNPTFVNNVNKAFEQTNLRHKKTFVDYDSVNIFDSFMKSIDPFWMYQSQRWPYLVNQAITHPGIITTWGRYQNYSEDGYFHIPGADIALNPFRGTIFMGGMGGLMRQFPAAQEDGILGGLAQATDRIAKAGFYPGFWITLPLGLAHINDIELPPILESVINLTGLSPVDLGIMSFRDKVLPNKFRDQYTAVIVSDLSQKDGLNYNGDDVRRHIKDGSATEEELAIWKEAQKKVAAYSILFEQTGVFKLDPETRREANLEVAKIIEQITGRSPEEQDAITDRLGSSGLRLSDILPLDPATQRQLNELNKYKLWAGLSNATKPSELRDMAERIDEYWEEVEKKQHEGRVTGFTDSRGNKFESLDSLDKQFRDGTISAKVWLEKQAATRAQTNAQIEGVRQSRRFEKVPITLEQKLKHYEDTGVPVPVLHPAKELLNTYYSISPIGKDGQPDWDFYYASIDSLIESLPSERKQYFLDYIQKDWTQTQKLYWEANNKYIRPYRNIRETLLQALPANQRDFINQYKDAGSAEIKNLPEEHGKLLSMFNADVGRANQRFRQLAPTTEAWLYYFDRVTTLSSESAREIYNDLVRKYPGPKPLLVPVEEKRSLLPALP